MKNARSSRFNRTLASFLAALFLLALLLLVAGLALAHHWAWSFLFIAFFSGGIAIGLWDLGRGRLNLWQAVGTIVLLVGFSAADFATISFALASTGLALHSGAPVVTFWHLLAYYGWHFLDLLPAMDAVKTLDLAPPIRHHGVVAGLPISVFKAFVVLVLLKTIKDWWSVSSPPQITVPDTTAPTGLSRLR